MDDLEASGWPGFDPLLGSHFGDVTFDRRTVLLAVDDDFAPIGLEQPGQEVHERGLTSTVRADDEDPFALRFAEPNRDVVGGAQFAELLS